MKSSGRQIVQDKFSSFCPKNNKIYIYYNLYVVVKRGGELEKPPRMLFLGRITMYYFDISKCRHRDSHVDPLKEECRALIIPFLSKLSKVHTHRLRLGWTTRSSFGFVFCDFEIKRSGARLVGKGGKRLFELVRDECDFVLLSDKLSKLSQTLEVDGKKVLVINITDFKWFMKTFSDQKNAVNLLLNKFNDKDAKIILKWFRSAVGEMNEEEVKEITTEAKSVNEEVVVNAVKQNPTLMLKLAKQLEDSDFDTANTSEFSSAIVHIQDTISSRNIDKITKLLETLKDEGPASIDALNEHLKHMTLDSVNRTLQITRGKIQQLNQFKSMLENPNTYEGQGSSGQVS